MSKEAKPRGLADLDALTPPAKPKREAPASKPSADPARSDRATAPRPTRTRSAAGLTAAPRQRVKIRSQVFYLPDDQIEALNRLSRQSERSKSDLVREAITDYLKRP